MISIIIPAHNEEAVIRSTLATLLDGLDPDHAEVIVVCNGCDDRTAAVAESFGSPVHVIEIETASKIEALNVGDSEASGFPRIYLDADIEIDAASVAQLVEVLQRPGAAAAEPVPRIDTSRSSLLVKAYYTVAVALHGQRPGDIGCGLYAMSEDGRNRFALFPDVIADDAFVRAHFAADELVHVTTASSVVHAPTRVEDLLQIKTRSRLGTVELQRKYPKLWAGKVERTASLIDKATALPMRTWAAVPVYVALQLIARGRARKLAADLDSYRWRRDDSSRNRSGNQKKRSAGLDRWIDSMLRRRKPRILSGECHDAAEAADAPSVTVTIVNHEAQEHLRACLQSLARHPYTLGAMKIIVLDNASDDRSLEMLRVEFPDVVVMAEQVRRGFGTNQNRAVAASSGELAFLLNPDATVGDGTIDALVATISRDRRVVAAGCRTLNADGTARQEWPAPFPTPTGIYAKAFGLGKLRRTGPLSSDIFADRWLSGGAMLVDRRVFLEVAGFDEDFFMYSEDVDLCKRLVASGHLIAWAPEASVVHPLARESSAMSQMRQREIVRAELS